MNELTKIIAEQIKLEGPISIAQFMQQALQNPDYGYYVSGDPLGVDGDFITAPEISQMFGEMIGIWCVEVWRQMGSPSQFALLEMGPGRGTLMQDVLRATAKVTGFHEAAKIYLMESNETLRAEQMEKLETHKPVFIDEPCLLPPLPLIVLANEFFDALPVQQFVKTANGWRERKVDWDGSRFSFVLSPHEVTLPLPEELSFFELSPQSILLMQEVASAIVQRGGAALVVDYGYAQAGGQDTLQAVSGHAYANPLERVGEIDLTTHVDFAALRATAEKQGAKVTEITHQGAFLRAMGVDLRAMQLKMKATPQQARSIDLDLRRLTDSAQMGELFKVMALCRNDIKEMPGFS